MATPDPSTLTSTADIFSGGYTLPQIRAIYDSLHVSIEEKAGRLRTQVGGSYRELLGTADTIVQMRSDNERVQELLSGMGSRCGRAVAGSKVSGLANFVQRDDDHHHTKAGVEKAARVKLLDACGLVSSKGDRLIMAAKVLVLSRIVAKSLGTAMLEARLARQVEASKKALGSLRRRLLRQVDKVLRVVTRDEDRDRVVKALCAYSLATSSGAKDALRHLLHARAEAMAMALDSDDDGSRRSRGKDGDAGRGERERVMLSLALYTRSLLDVQAIVPGRLSQAMAQLMSRPLLEDPSLKQLYGLRLDVYEHWFSDEMQYFTPFIRHDDLDGKLARETLAGWSERGAAVFLDGLKAALSHTTEFKAIMDLRNAVLRLWIRDGGRARGLDPTAMQDELRSVINERMLAVLEAKVAKLHLVGSEVQSTLETWEDGVTDRNKHLWGDDVDQAYDEALSQVGGGGLFLGEVVTRLYGRNEAVSRAVESYRAWFRVTDDVRDVVASLTRQRWDNDVDEVEDEDTIDARQQALSRDDPDTLRTTLHRSLDAAFSNLEKQLSGLWGRPRPDSGPVAMYFLRVLRDIRTQLPDRPSTAAFGLSMVPELHAAMVEAVCGPPLEGFPDAVLAGRTVVGRILWEDGLPTQPSPGLFGFMRDMSAAMAEAGTDLWTPSAVTVVKRLMDGRLVAAWREELVRLEDEDDEDDEDEAKLGELRVQWLFDATYLECCLGKDGAQMKGMVSALREAVDLDEASRKDLVNVLLVDNVHLRSADELLDADERLADEVRAQTVVYLAHDAIAEGGVSAGGGGLRSPRLVGEDGVDEAAPLELGSGDAPAHDEGLVGLRHAQALDQGARGTPLGHQAQGGEGREEEGVGRGVDEVGEGDEGGRQADDGPVQADDQDLGVRAEGVAGVEVEGYEALEPVLVSLDIFRDAPRDGYVGASIYFIVSGNLT
ncbi:conserved oligomeric Golgi complex subunit 1 [Geosmithia morbida]|uniref:Conserved oligomeric Golgi complex subunit 1 n=1 Tax=Geosmithia morbida TaxID=1094350 RepID=A0A9P5D0W1_9HYPO|nr:conserved oligomeric Golgi complex subunit 1 [Geosmithia morbida]KAF4123168.1 conserved oligomeric Golgi complex subunit 1 [Geosmithia morbida]